MKVSEYAERVVDSFSDIISEVVTIEPEKQRHLALRCSAKFIQAVFDASEPDSVGDQGFKDALSYIQQELKK